MIGVNKDKLYKLKLSPHEPFDFGCLNEQYLFFNKDFLKNNQIYLVLKINQ